MVGGVGGYSCGKVVVERGKLVQRGWRPAGTTGRLRFKMAADWENGEVEKTVDVELVNVVLGGVPAVDGAVVDVVLGRVEVVHVDGDWLETEVVVEVEEADKSELKVEVGDWIDENRKVSVLNGVRLKMMTSLMCAGLLAAWRLRLRTVACILFLTVLALMM